VQYKAMLKIFQQWSEWRSVVAPVVAILLISAILLAFVLPIIDAGFDYVAFSLPVVVFFLLAPAAATSRWVPSGKIVGRTELFLNAFAGRAPPA
jgi:predicted benzoate:H+ symporter BenE